LPTGPALTHTAGINPELLGDQTLRIVSSQWLVIALAVVIALGFGFRVANLGAESLGEDELNKLMAVADYRAHGLTAANGEHPMLMKVAQTISVTAAEKWDAFGFVARNPAWHITTEGALRFPCALLGTFTALLLFLLVQNLFGTRVALLTAAFWALDPNAIGFNRIAKEDSFVLFFFLLANVFWVRAQRIAENGTGRFVPYYWATAAAFGAMIASKYLPHFLGISVGYYYIFQGIPETKWRLGKVRYATFLLVMGIAFLLCNPAIVLPETWRQMRAFASEHRINHDSYEFIGTLYRNQSSLWFKGIPWYFYFAFIALKAPLTVIIGAILGAPRLLLKRIGDGRYFVLIWILFWFMPFSVLGGKFTRYFTLGLPIVHIAAALGINWLAGLSERLLSRAKPVDGKPSPLYVGWAAVALCFCVIASASATPIFRLYTNVIGGGWSQAGSYFPHDEFYDGATRDAVSIIVKGAPPGKLTLTETPGLYAYYAKVLGREDLRFSSLSDPAAVAQVKSGDYVAIARGRSYFSNARVRAILKQPGADMVEVYLGPVPAVRIYRLTESSAIEIASGR
jgi:hypothetical protein